MHKSLIKNYMIYKFFVLVFSGLFISGCTTAFVTGASKAVLIEKEERSFSNFVEDTIILAQLKNAYFSNNEKIFFNVSVEVLEGKVLLTGSVDKVAERIEATKLAWSIEGVNEVMNEIQISNDDSILDYDDDLFIKTKIKDKLLLNEGIFNLNYSVEVGNGVVYLIGIAQNKEELDRVINISENTYGTKNVVSYIRLKENKI